MSLNLSHCVPEDARKLADSHLATYGGMPRHKAAYRKVPHDILLTLYEEEFRKAIETQSQPSPTQHTHYLKVTDPPSGEMMAYVIWKYLPEGYKVEDDDQAQVKSVPEGSNETLIRDFGAMLGKIRCEHPGRREAHWLLSLLGTVPKYERRGAGGMLIRWAFSQADKDQKRCYVDASAIGYALYKRCGFKKDVGQISVDLDKYEPELGLGTVRWFAMMREPQTAECHGLDQVS